MFFSKFGYYIVQKRTLLDRCSADKMKSWFKVLYSLKVVLGSSSTYAYTKRNIQSAHATLYSELKDCALSKFNHETSCTIMGRWSTMLLRRQPSCLFPSILNPDFTCGLKPRQYQNDSIQSKIIPTLKLPRFFHHLDGEGKERQFQNQNYF